MAITKVTRTLLSTGIVDNSNATAITIDSSENTTFSGSILSNIAGNNSTGGNIRIGLVSDDVAKYNAITSTQYDSGTETEGFTLISAHSTDASTNNINIGGSFGEQNSATSIRLYTAANATTRTGSERMRIDSSGNVGIGTSSPNAPLEINGGTGMTGGWGRSLLLRHPFPMMVFQGEYSTDTYAGIGYDNTSGMQFMVNSPTIDLFANSQTPAMIILDNKNVGIKTTSPAYTLDVNGNIGVGTTSTGQSILQMLTSTTGTGTIHFGDGGGNNLYAGYIQYAHANNSLQFGTSHTEKMRLDTSGNLLVGKTSSSFASVGVELKPTEGLIATVNGSECAMLNRLTSTGTIQRFKQAGTDVGSISVTASSTAYNTSSDGRLKDVTGSARGLEVINELNPVSYNWKADGKADEGLIAQEVLNIVPNSVSGSEEDMYQMDYSKLVVHLVAGMKEQQTQIEALQSEINLLKGE